MVNWASAVGYLRYHDLSGTEWQTHFRFRRDAEGNISVAILAAGETSQFGEPGYNGEEGWTNLPADVCAVGGLERRDPQGAARRNSRRPAELDF